MACDTLDQFIRRMASTLVDAEHITWTEADITDAVSDGLSAISSHRPEMFVEPVEVTLVPGSLQTLPEGTIAIVGNIHNICVAVDGTTTDGPIATMISADDIRALSYVASTNCISIPTGDPATITAQSMATNSCKLYQVSSYVFDPRRPTSLIVSPSVPVGVRPRIQIIAQKCAPCLTWPESKGAELPCKYRPELKEYAMYALLSKQRESEAALGNAARHLTNFYNMMGIKYRQESHYQSGFFLGAKGDGDQAVVRG